MLSLYAEPIALYKSNNPLITGMSPLITSQFVSLINNYQREIWEYLELNMNRSSLGKLFLCNASILLWASKRFSCVNAKNDPKFFKMVKCKAKSLKVNIRIATFLLPLDKSTIASYYLNSLSRSGWGLSSGGPAEDIRLVLRKQITVGQFNVLQ